jgi:2-C-methyl-D-erythritol 2,4-cyclodiphosphate synthase
MTAFRTGIGVDFHQLREGEKLMLGGVHIPHYKGSVGHSDADVLLHAICDALLGAAGLDDIGTYFPDTDPAYKGADSKMLLEKTVSLIKARGYQIVNIDTTICLQEPKIKQFTPRMKDGIASIAGIATSDIGIKATTTEQMGFVGREEGIMAYATVLLTR